MKSDPDLLREVGEALFGSTWQSELARELEVAIRTVQRWASGTSAVPERLWNELGHLCLQRGTTLTALAGKLMDKPPRK